MTAPVFEPLNGAPQMDGVAASALRFLTRGSDVDASGVSSFVFATKGGSTELGPMSLGAGSSEIAFRTRGGNVAASGQSSLAFGTRGHDLSVPTPDYSVGVSSFAFGTTAQDTSATYVDAVLPLAFKTRGSDTNASGQTSITFGTRGTERGAEVVCVLSMTPGFLLGYPGIRPTQTIERIELSATPLGQIIQGMLERIALGDGPRSMAQLLGRIAESLDLGDQHAAIWAMLVQETIGIAGAATPSVTAIASVLDALVLLAGPGATLEISILLAETLALADAIATVERERVSEAAVFDDAYAAALQAHAALLDSLLIGDTLGGGVLIRAVVDESLVLDGVQTVTAELFARLVEHLALCVTVTIGDDTYLAWVVNTETRGAWQYENYPFNSFAGPFNGKYYGMAADGLYELGGDTDDGDAIKARFRLGMSNLGTGIEKRMPACYLGYRADGCMILKAIVTEIDGSRSEHWYELRPRGDGSVREGRIQLGRGLKAVFWDFEIANVKGADFELADMQLYPMVLDRRVKGRDSR